MALPKLVKFMPFLKMSSTFGIFKKFEFYVKISLARFDVEKCSLFPFFQLENVSSAFGSFFSIYLPFFLLLEVNHLMIFQTKRQSSTQNIGL